MILSIFTRPVFINPLAYLVIPELALIHRSTPYDFSSNKYVFQVITTGLIEGKLLLAGNEYILHLDLYSKDGNVVLGEFYLDGSSIGSTDKFILELSNGFVTLTFNEGGGSGNIAYPGLIAAWSAKGKSNDDEDRATLRDLTGNGHDISLNGFAFSEMSGYGGYNYTYNKDYYLPASNGTFTNTNNILRLNLNKGIGVLFVSGESSNFTWKNYKIQVKGMYNGDILRHYYGENGISKYLEITKDGVYIIPDSFTDVSSGGYKTFMYCNVSENKIITIEILPEYPDALVFDGVDDYGINEDIPILTDYTIIAKRRRFTNTKKGWTASKIIPKTTQGEFLFENNLDNCNLYSFGTFGVGIYNKEDISFQTPTSYNGQKLKKGTSLGGNRFTLGCLGRGIEEFFQGAIWCVYLFNRSLDEQEIKEFIRKHIDPEYHLPSEIPTPAPDCYYDFSQGSNDDKNRDTIKDLSGNGNDAVAHNFAWNEEGSG